MKTIAATFGLALAMVALLTGSATGHATKPAQATTLSPISHVVLVMEENHSLSQVIGNSCCPFVNSIAKAYTNETNDWALNFPSLPNYVILTSGSTKSNTGTFAGTDCSPSTNCQTNRASIFSQLGSNWRALEESMPTACDHSNGGEYAVRHDPPPYYTSIASACKTQDVPYSASTTPNISAAYTFVTPNLLHDAHDGSLAAMDTWLKTFMGKLMATTQYQSGNTLVEITFDSGSGNCGSTCQSHVPLILVNPQIKGKVLTFKTTHCSVLRLDEELLGKPLLGCASTAADLRTALGL